MPTRDWTSLDWSPTLNFALPNERQLAQSSLADAGKGAEYKFAANTQNAALLQALGYGGQALTDVPDSDYGFGPQSVWSDEARNWLSQNGYNVGVAHDPGTSAGGRAEYFGLTGPDGQFTQGQSDPTTTTSDTLADQIAMFATFLGPAIGGIAAAGGGLGGAGVSLGSGMGGIAADGASLGSGMAGAAGSGATGLAGAGSGVTSLGSAWSPQALGLTGGIAPGVTSAELAALSSALPGAVEVGAGAAGGLGSSLVQNGGSSIWDALQNGALKGAAKGGITSAIKGQNPLKGALGGALSGAIGGGISSVGQGALGNLMSGLDSSSADMGIIPGAFDGATDSADILNNLGSFGDAASSAGGSMDWNQWLAGMDPSGSWMPGLSDLGSFSDPGFDWGSVNLSGLPNMSLDLGGAGLSGSQLGSFGDAPINLGSGLDGFPQADYSNEGKNYSGPGAIDPVGNSPAYTSDTPYIDLSGTSSNWLQTLLDGAKGAVGSAAGAVGGGGNLAALIGAGLGAASGGGTQTSSRDPWGASQPFLKNVLGTADGMLTNLQQNPFTQQQTQQYQQAYSSLDQARAAMPGLLNWGQTAMGRQSTTPSYEQLFGGGQQMQPAQPPAQPPAGLLGQQPQFGGPQPTMQAGGPGGLLGNDDRMKALMARGRGLIG